MRLPVNRNLNNIIKLNDKVKLSAKSMFYILLILHFFKSHYAKFIDARPQDKG